MEQDPVITLSERRSRSRHRRGAGEGSIYRRKDGRWTGVLNLGRIDGRRARQTFYGKSRQAVQLALREAASKFDKGLLTTSDRRRSVASFLDSWLEQKDVRASTRTAYEINVRRHIVPTIGHIALDKLSPSDVQAMLRAKLASGLSPRSVHHLRSVLRAALNQALRWGYVSRNAAALSELPAKVERFHPHFLGPEEAQRFLEAVKSDRLEGLYGVALAVGLREGEALGLKWEDVELDAQKPVLHVNRSLGRVKGAGLMAMEPKTERSRRTVTLPAVAAQTLRAHRVRQLQERLLAGSRWRETGYVFTTSIGTPLSASNVLNRSLRRLCERAGMPRLRFHDLRHSCATLLLVQGIPARVVADVLGHSEVSLTLNTYSHVVPGMLDDAARAMDRALGS